MFQFLFMELVFASHTLSHKLSIITAKSLNNDAPLENMKTEVTKAEKDKLCECIQRANRQPEPWEQSAAAAGSAMSRGWAGDCPQG